MVVQKTPRTGLEKYTDGTDPHPNRSKFNSERDLLDAIVALANQGPTGSRPAAGILNRLYWDTTVKRLYWDDGSIWNEITTNGGGGAGQTIRPGVAASEGASGRSARADHSHLLVLATAAVDGAMSAADKSRLDGATSLAMAETIATRDIAGRIQVAAPAANGDASTKGYVDGLVGTRAPAVHTHGVADLTDAGATGTAVIKAATTATARTAIGLGSVDNTADIAKPISAATATALAGKANTTHTHTPADITGTLAPAQLPAATALLQGALSPADKAKLDAASAAATPNTLVMLDANGRAQVNTPAATTDMANKAYVDTGLSGKSDTSHTHTWSEISGKPGTFAPDVHTHAWTDVTGRPATFTPSAHGHSGADITSGLVSPDRIANAGTTTDGLMSATDKTKLNAASAAATPNTIMMADANGRYSAATPSSAGHVANKGYVDGLASDYAAANHTHTWNSVTGKPTTFTPSAHTHDWDSLTGKPTLVSLAYADNNYAYKSHGHSWSQISNKSDIYNTNAATGSYRAVWVNSAGVVGHNLSSEKYKTNITDYVVPLDVLDAVTPKCWNYKTDVATLGAAAPQRVNFVAEDLHDAGLTEYVSYDGEGTARENVETINEQLIVNALWSFAKQQRTQIADLQKRLTAMDGHA